MDETLPRFRWPLYLLAIGLIVIPFLDFATSILPLSPTDIRWRFTTTALFAGFLFTPLLAIGLVILLATLTGDRVVLRVLAIFNLVVATVLLGLLALFLLDVVQLRHDTVGELERQPFDMSALRALVKYGFTITVLTALGVIGFKVSRAKKSSRDSRRESMPLVSTQG